MSPPFLSDPSSHLLPGTSQSSEAMARAESSSSASSSSSTVWNYLWIPLLISFSKELSLAKAHHSSASNPILCPSTADIPPEPSCPNPDPKLNFRPVIGILSHPGDGASGRLDGSPDASYIAASYVKFVESAGARVIPLIYNEPARVLEKKLNMVNGVLFTGGWAKDGSYFETVEKIFKYVLAKNDAGEHFPLYAICLGFELLTMIISKNNNILEEFDATDEASTLDFIRNTNIEGTVFQRFPPDLLRKLSTDCLVMQNHHYGISLERLQETSDLRSFFKVLTTSTDRDNKAYVSTVQANNYPVSAFQWHPEWPNVASTCSKSMLKNASRAMTALKSEVHTARYISGQWPVVVDYTLKNAFEWGLSMIPHTDEAIQVTQHVANFFVSEARKSPNRPSARKVLDNLIYNYSPTYCGKSGRGYDEVYIFTKPSIPHVKYVI